MNRLLLVLPLAACAGSGSYAPQGCEPGSPVEAVVSGSAAVGASNEGLVTDSDIGLTIGVTTGSPACR